MKILIVILMFLLLSAFFIISDNELAISNKENFSVFLNLYVGWLDRIFLNLQTIIKKFSELEWMPK